jgi:hypothetical protein
MAFFAFLHRQTLAPDIAAASIIVMAGGAVQAGGFVRLVPEKHRTFSSWLKLRALQGTNRFWFSGPRDFGTQKQNHRQGPKNYFCLQQPLTQSDLSLKSSTLLILFITS